MSDKTSLSDLARQAGFVLVNGQHCRSIASPEDLEKFAALHRASIIAELCANAVEPVYELRHIGGLWVNSTTGDYELAQKTRGYETRILYRAETVAALQARVAELENKLANIPTEYPGVKCMCVQTKCRAGPGCPHYNKHCEAHIDHIRREALRSKK